jgi:carotenoid cleavage dioxygenase
MVEGLGRPERTEAAMSTVTNPYLQGNYAPVREEVVGTGLPVSGSIPEELCGR